MSDTEIVIPGPGQVIPSTGKYLRNRPFLLVTLVRRPAKGVRTEKKGWMEVTGNVDLFEQPVLVDRVNAIHLRNANIIIDVMNATVVKNSMAESNSDEEVVNYYLNKYREHVEQAMDLWLTNVAERAVNRVVERKKEIIENSSFSAA